MVNFDPWSQEDADRAQSMVLEPGLYTVTVFSAEDKKSAKGNDMVAVVLLYEGEEGERNIRDWILPNHEKMGWRFRHFCYACGLGDAYESGSVDPDDAVGKILGVKLKIDSKDKDFGPQNRVVDYYSHEEMTGMSTGNAKHSDNPLKPDDIPF